MQGFPNLLCSDQSWERAVKPKTKAPTLNSHARTCEDQTCLTLPYQTPFGTGVFKHVCGRPYNNEFGN